MNYYQDHIVGVRGKTVEDYIKQIEELEVECLLWSLKYNLINHTSYVHEKCLENDKKAVQADSFKSIMVAIGTERYSYLAGVSNDIYDSIDKYGTRTTLKVLKKIYDEYDELQEESESGE